MADQASDTNNHHEDNELVQDPAEQSEEEPGEVGCDEEEDIQHEE